MLARLEFKTPKVVRAPRRFNWDQPISVNQLIDINLKYFKLRSNSKVAISFSISRLLLAKPSTSVGLSRHAYLKHNRNESTSHVKPAWFRRISQSASPKLTTATEIYRSAVFHLVSKSKSRKVTISRSNGFKILTHHSDRIGFVSAAISCGFSVLSDKDLQPMLRFD